MRATSTCTTWTCDACGTEVNLTDGFRMVPPSGWRITTLLPEQLNMALEPDTPAAVRKRAVCGPCMNAPVVLSALFSDDG